jgi:hypothetical protein
MPGVYKAAASTVLSDAGILHQVFSFLPGNWLFLGAVCQEWSSVYAGLAEQQVHSLSLTRNSKVVAYGPKTTLYSAAVASFARARLACDCGLASSTSDSLQLIAGLHADMQTLSALRGLGMPRSKTVLHAVALSGRLDVLQRLVTGRRWPGTRSLSFFAARSGSISMLKWLRAERRGEFDDQEA